jgi:branched-chain amino acid transport system permease protein
LKFFVIRILSVLAALGFAFGVQAIAAGRDAFTQQLIVLAGLYVTLAVSLNLINGITGQFSIGHAAFYQVGAYTSAFFGSTWYPHWHNGDLSWLLLMTLMGTLTAGIAGFLVGLPSLRLRGDYLAIVTLGFGEIVRIVVQNQKVLGESGGLDVKPHIQQIWVVVILAIICVALCRNLLKTAHGLPFLAVREDEVASSAMGVNVTKTKVTAFVIGSAFAGAAGAIFANQLGAINPDLFRMDQSFIILTMVVLGGTGSITGSVFAALVLFYIPEKMRDISEVKLSILVGMLLSVGLAVAAIRYVINHVHKSAGVRAGMFAGIVAGAGLLTVAMGAALGATKPFQGSVEGAKLRLVVFAITLIVLMLIRPQGIFAHHEFSWDWVKKIIGRKDYHETEVAI